MFSDKTGTLTENSLDFRKCVIGHTNYGKGETEIGRAAKMRQLALTSNTGDNMNNNLNNKIANNINNNNNSNSANNSNQHINRVYSLDPTTKAARENNAPHVNFDEVDKLRNELFNSNKPNASEQSLLVARFLRVLAINNSCYPVIDDETGERVIRAASPDDQCLTCFADFIGVELTERKTPKVLLSIAKSGIDSIMEEEEEKEPIKVEDYPINIKKNKKNDNTNNNNNKNENDRLTGKSAEKAKQINDRKDSSYYLHLFYLSFVLWFCGFMSVWCRVVLFCFDCVKICKNTVRDCVLRFKKGIDFVVCVCVCVCWIVTIEKIAPGNTNQEYWEQLAELEFTSKRKRMSVIVRNNKTGKIHVTMKGADSEMFPLIADWPTHKNKDKTEEYLAKFSEEGLRTLVVGEGIQDSEWWDGVNGWAKKLRENEENTVIETEAEKGHIKGSCADDCRKCTFFNEIEKSANIELLGITAIEDKLQESVPETIRAMLDGKLLLYFCLKKLKKLKICLKKKV